MLAVIVQIEAAAEGYDKVQHITVPAVNGKTITTGNLEDIRKEDGNMTSVQVQVTTSTASHGKTVSGKFRFSVLC